MTKKSLSSHKSMKKGGVKLKPSSKARSGAPVGGGSVSRLSSKTKNNSSKKSTGLAPRNGVAKSATKIRAAATTKTAKLAGVRSATKGLKATAKTKVASKVKSAKATSGAASIGKNRIANLKPATSKTRGLKAVVGRSKAPKSGKLVEAKKLSGKVSGAKHTSTKKVAVRSDYSDFRAMLLQKRRRLFGDVAMMSEEALGSEETMVDSHAPIHPAEVGSHSFEQEFTLGLLSRDGDKIRTIDVALEKLAEGTYGMCDECGGRIPKGRLEMLPESIYCVKCASKIEGI